MSNEHEIEALRFQLLAASCYIDALGGDSRSYRAALVQPATSATAAQPLTEEQIHRLSNDCYDGCKTHPLILFARAIEMAHGICGKA